MQTITAPKGTSAATSYAGTSNIRSFDLDNNTIFQNLLNDASVNQFIERQEDGSYDWTWTPSDGPTTTQQSVARWLIGSAEGTIDSGATHDDSYTQSDIDLFKTLTGYNLVITPAGASLVCNDFGTDVPKADESLVNEARTLIDTITFARRDANLGSGPLALDDVPAVLQRYGGNANGDFDAAETVLKNWLRSLGADEATVAKLQRHVGRDAGGNAFATFSFSEDIDLTSKTFSESETLLDLLF
jgi:hypothetical protein